MGWLKVAVVALLLALGIGVIYLRRARPQLEPEPEPLQPNPHLVRKWRKATLWDFDIYLPEAWSHKVARAPGTKYGVEFFGPEVKGGFRIMILFFWGPTKRDLGSFYRLQRDKREIPGLSTKILDEGSTTVAGLPARYLVYEAYDRHPDTGKRMRFVTIDWYFVGRSKAGILRGVATGPAFIGGYGDVFRAVAARLRFHRP